MARAELHTTRDDVEGNAGVTPIAFIQLKAQTLGARRIVAVLVLRRGRIVVTER